MGELLPDWFPIGLCTEPRREPDTGDEVLDCDWSCCCNRNFVMDPRWDMVELMAVFMLVSIDKLFDGHKDFFDPSWSSLFSLLWAKPLRYSISILSASQRLISPVAEVLQSPLSPLLHLADRFPRKNVWVLDLGVDGCEPRRLSIRLVQESRRKIPPCWLGMSHGIRNIRQEERVVVAPQI